MVIRNVENPYTDYQAELTSTLEDSMWVLGYYEYEKGMYTSKV